MRQASVETVVETFEVNVSAWANDLMVVPERNVIARVIAIPVNNHIVVEVFRPRNIRS